MNIAKGAGAGILVGILGATCWAMIAYFANLEIGYLAWGIGAAVGIVVSVAASESNPILGLIAVLITAASICGGKYVIVETQIQSALSEIDIDTDSDIEETVGDEEALISYIADDIVVAKEAEGKTYAWPEGIEPEYAAEKADYPILIWREAESTWNKMSESERDTHKEKVKAMVAANIDAFQSQLASNLNEARSEGFLSTFSAFDLLFFGLGIVTAWRFAGAGDEVEAA